MKMIDRLLGLLGPSKHDIKRVELGPVGSSPAPAPPRAIKRTEPAPDSFTAPPPPVEPPKVVRAPRERPFSERLEEATTVEECIELYVNVVPNSSDETLVVSKLTKLATVFDDWILILNNTAVDSPLRQQATSRLEALATTFDQWKTLYEVAHGDKELSNLEAKAIAGLCQSADEIEELLYAYQATTTNSLEMAAVIESLCKKGLAGDEWETVLEDLSDDDPLYKRSVEVRIAALDSLASCEALYDVLNNASVNTDAVIQRTKECQEGFQDWVDMYQNRSDLDVFSSTLLERAISLAKEPADFMTLIGVVEDKNDDDETKLVEDALEKMNWSKDQWEALRDDSNDGCTFENIAYLHLLVFEGSTHDVLGFYLDYMEDHESPEDDVVGAIEDKLLKVASRQELEIISLLADTGVDLDDLASVVKGKLTDAGQEPAS